MSDAVFRREGARFVPGLDSSGPWSPDLLHGGPIFGLLAHAIEAAAPDPSWIATRYTFDLSRAVPLVPVEVKTQVLRQSGRLCLVHAVLRAGDEEFVSATALLLRESDAGTVQHETTTPAGPDGLQTETLMRGAWPNLKAGFHVRVETRWVPRTPEEPLAIWFRMPIPLIEGEPDTALQRAIQLCDFTNAVASMAQRERVATPTPFINVDATLYLSRRPVGEWFCLRERSLEIERGISVVSCDLFDERGGCGHVTQGRLANRMRR